MRAHRKRGPERGRGRSGRLKRGGLFLLAKSSSPLLLVCAPLGDHLLHVSSGVRAVSPDLLHLTLLGGEGQHSGVVTNVQNVGVALASPGNAVSGGHLELQIKNTSQNPRVSGEAGINQRRQNNREATTEATRRRKQTGAQTDATARHQTPERQPGTHRTRRAGERRRQRNQRRRNRRTARAQDPSKEHPPEHQAQAWVVGVVGAGIYRVEI